MSCEAKMLPTQPLTVTSVKVQKLSLPCSTQTQVDLRGAKYHSIQLGASSTGGSQDGFRWSVMQTSAGIHLGCDNMPPTVLLHTFLLEASAGMRLPAQLMAASLYHQDRGLARDLYSNSCYADLTTLMNYMRCGVSIDPFEVRLPCILVTGCDDQTIPFAIGSTI